MLEKPFRNYYEKATRMKGMPGANLMMLLESRLDSIRKSRLLLDRINEALSVLKRKPGDGARMYELIYLTYLGPDKLSHADLLYRLDISSRHYYRLRQQAITILSIRLWAAPASEVDSWLEVLTLLEDL